jgi:hypothetical protein
MSSKRKVNNSDTTSRNSQRKKARRLTSGDVELSETSVASSAGTHTSRPSSAPSIGDAQSMAEWVNDRGKVIDSLWIELDWLSEEYNEKLAAFKLVSKTARSRYQQQRLRAKTDFSSQLYDAVASHADDERFEALEAGHGLVDPEVAELARQMQVRLLRVRWEVQAKMDEKNPVPALGTADEKTVKKVKHRRYVEWCVGVKKGKEAIMRDLGHAIDFLHSDALKAKRNELWEEYSRKIGEVDEMCIADIQRLELAFIPKVVEMYEKQLNLSQKMDAAELTVVEVDEED